MKKYVIMLGENADGLGRQVQKALFAVGFVWFSNLSTPLYKGIVGICVNVRRDGGMSTLNTSDVLIKGIPSGTLILSPSYVIEHAAELEGAVVRSVELTVSEIEKRLNIVNLKVVGETLAACTEEIR